MAHLCCYAQDFKLFEKGSLSFVHQNMRSMHKNITGLETFLSLMGNKNPTIIGVSETWLASQEQAELKKFQLPGYTFLNKCRIKDSSRGGAGIYIQNEIKYRQITDIVLSQAESIWVEISVQGLNVTVGVVYSSAKLRNINIFINELDETFEKLNQQKKRVVLMGDINIDLMRCRTSDPYFQALLSNGMKSMIVFPTRVQKESRTLIDHILTNMTNLDSEPIGGTLLNDISDHYTTFAVFPNMLLQHVNANQVIEKQILSFKKYNPDIAKAQLQEENWADIFSQSTVNDAFRTFVNKLSAYQSKVTELVQLTVENRYQQPWMTSEIRRAQKERYRLYKRSKSKPDNKELQEKYKRYRNDLCRLMRETEKKYYSNLIDKAEGNQGRTWHVINDIMGRKKRKAGLPDEIVLENQKVVQGTENVINALNDYFITVGPCLASKIPTSRKEPEDYLVDLPDTNSFFLSPITEQEILSFLQKIKSRKSSGPDNLHPRYIKDVATEITAPLTHIVNMSIMTGEVPDYMKIARVVPLYKAGDKNKATNYRPISLLSVLAKVLEGTVYKRLMKYFCNKHLLSEAQFGFRQNKNTKGALIKFINTIQNGIDRGRKTGAVYIDLKKAFDTVDYKILFIKLQKYGIRGIALEWFKSYLSNRKQFIEYNEVKSSFGDIKCGVPQGSNLGPLLFLIYVNDLPRSLEVVTPTLFADDTTICATADTMSQLEQKINRDLALLNEWFIANKLTLNVSKSYACTFGNSPNFNQIQLKVDNREIELSGVVKYLGVYVDSKLNWVPHINRVANKVSQTIGILSKIRHTLNQRCLKTVYYSLIHSRLLYCQEIWGTATKTALQPLTILQKKCMRIIVGAQYRTHTEPIYRELGIRPLLKEIEFRRALLAYEIMNNVESVDVTIERTHTHDYSTRFVRTNLPIPRKNTKRFGTAGLESCLINAYNNLPVHVKEQQPNSKRMCKRIISGIF